MSLPSLDTAVVDRHTSLSGTVSGHDLIVVGILEGELRLSGRLHIVAGSRLRARVEANVVDLDGEFEGELRTEVLRVSASARARGVFVADRISIEEGAFVEGDVQAPAVVASPEAAEPALTSPAAGSETPPPDEPIPATAIS